MQDTLIGLGMILCVFSRTASAEPRFYAVDTQSDTLVIIDGSTGSVSLVGELGIDAVSGITLEWVDNSLVMLADVGAGNESVVMLDHTTGGALSVHEISIPDSHNAEGLAVVRAGPEAGQIWIGHGAPPFSTTLSEITLAGELVRSVSVSVDIDNMIWFESHMRCHDGIPQTPSSSSRTNLMGTISFDNGFNPTGSVVTDIDDALGDLAIDDLGRLWSNNNRENNIARIDVANGSKIETIEYQSDSLLRGLAFVRSCTADLTGEGETDFFDVSFLLQNSIDYNGDTQFDFFDISAFLQDLAQGCP